MAGRGQEVTDVFVVDFEIGDTNGVGDVWGDAGFYALEEVLAGSWNEPWLGGGAHHRV